MAEKAQQEPTMEEILASIRKIIADDDQGSGAAQSSARRVVDVKEADEDAFDDLNLNDDAFEMDLPEEEERLLAALTGPRIAFSRRPSRTSSAMVRPVNRARKPRASPKASPDTHATIGGAGPPARFAVRKLAPGKGDP